MIVSELIEKLTQNTNEEINEKTVVKICALAYMSEDIAAVEFDKEENAIVLYGTP